MAHHLHQELEEYAAGQHAFTFEIEDPAGNSFIGGADGGPASEYGSAAGSHECAGDPHTALTCTLRLAYCGWEAAQPSPAPPQPACRCATPPHNLQTRPAATRS